MIYLDYNSTTPVDPLVLETMLPVFSKDFGNPASRTHLYGWRAEELLIIAREQVALAVGAEPSGLVFTSSGTEANNLALKGVAWALAASKDPKAIRIVSCFTEHSSILEPLDFLAQQGFQVACIQVDRDGHIQQEDFNYHLSRGCDLLSIMHANNETGVIHDLRRLLENYPGPRPLVHCDATQTLGKILVEINNLGADLLTISAHKIFGPKGAGALILRGHHGNMPMLPLMHGGNQEFGLRAGTVNLPAIVGFAKACEISVSSIDTTSQHLSKLDQMLIDFSSNQPWEIAVNGSLTNRLPGVLNLSFKGIDNNSLLAKLAGKVALSAGSACSSGLGKASHVLEAMGLEKWRLNSNLRISVGRTTTEAELSQALVIIKETIERLLQPL